MGMAQGGSALQSPKLSPKNPNKKTKEQNENEQEQTEQEKETKLGI